MLEYHKLRDLQKLVLSKSDYALAVSELDVKLILKEIADDPKLTIPQYDENGQCRHLTQFMQGLSTTTPKCGTCGMSFKYFPNTAHLVIDFQAKQK